MPSSLIDEHGHSLANHIAVLVTQTTPTQSHDFIQQYITEYLLKIQIIMYSKNIIPKWVEPIWMHKTS